MGRDSLWEVHMGAEIRKTEVQLDAVLAERVLRLRDVQALEVGQTLALNKHADDPLEIYSSGVRLGRALLGQRNQNVAIRLLTDIAKD